MVEEIPVVVVKMLVFDGPGCVFANVCPNFTIGKFIKEYGVLDLQPDRLFLLLWLKRLTALILRHHPLRQPLIIPLPTFILNFHQILIF